MALKYVGEIEKRVTGEGKDKVEELVPVQSLPGIPARDLSSEEVAAHGGEAFLLSSGIYKKAKSAPSSTKAASGPSEDK